MRSPIKIEVWNDSIVYTDFLDAFAFVESVLEVYQAKFVEEIKVQLHFGRKITIMVVFTPKLIKVVSFIKLTENQDAFVIKI
ncbi:hypothetical protein [Dyadobacter sp. 32]|uniref:hypothetical protein n=1 Tax=Dyadobacter sp. 32 TaxID=538966 RepID=UPI0011EC761A